MTAENPRPDDRLDVSAEEERLGELINEFFDRRERGENLSEDEFLAMYPQHADQLRQHLVGLQLLEGIGSSSDVAKLPGDDTEFAAGSSAHKPLTSYDGHLPVIPGYEISKQLGRGGMGVVYKAIQLSTRREVALKLLLEGPLATEQSRKRFEREVALAAQLRHPNIIPIYDSGKHDGRMYYAMEYVRGLPLLDHLRERALDLRGKLLLFTRVCAAVKHAHLRGVVHRDLKPTNVLVRADGEPQILDFGLAKAGALGDVTTSLTAQIVGTPAYMSPEQAAGDPAAIDSRTDIYSLGVVLYEMLTGAMPYETKVPMGRLLENIAKTEPRAPRQFDPRIDAELTAILMKALEKNVDERYQSVDSLSDDVVRYLNDEPISVQPPSSVYLIRKVLRRHKRLVAVSAAVLVIVCATGFAFRQSMVRTKNKERQLQEQISQKQQIQELADEVKRERDEREAILEVLDPETRAQLETIVQAASALTTPQERLTLLRQILDIKVNVKDAAPANQPKPKDLDFNEPFASVVPPQYSGPPADQATSLTSQVLSRLQTMITPPPAKPPQEATSRPALLPPAPASQPVTADSSGTTSAAAPSS